MKKLLMLLCAFAAGVAMAEQVEFRDYDADTGTFTNAVRECTLVTSETRTLENGWYAVMDEVVIPEWERLVVQGDAHLVLCDGATLRIPAADTGLAAILLSGKNSLTIYGQSLGSGSLEAVGGGVNLGDSRTDPGAGIGGDSNLSGGMVTINGGTVTARSGRKVLSDSIDSIVGFAGIGGNQATVTINGGTVLAQCLGGLGVGIGGNDARVAINGGVVTAQGVGNSQLGACDVGSYVAGCTVTIGGGSIDAFSIRGDIRISGGIFTIPIPDNWCADQFAPSGNADPATQGKYPHAVVPGWTVTIGSHPKTTAVWTSGNGVVSNAVEGSSFKVPDGSENVTVHFTAHSDYVLEGEATVALGTVTEDIVFGVGNEFAVPRGYCPLGDIPYLDWNGSQMTNAVLSKYDYALVTDATEEMTEGWYVVAQDIERDRIKVTGAVNLVLVDDRELSVSGTRDDVPGIDVSGSNRLTIYGQIKGTGQVTANGGERSAGIGGGAGGYVTINGGTVIAQSANAGAGIGGGSLAEGGIVAINGGTVTAMGGWGATGIGGGWGKGGGTATICGGAVTAKAGMQGESDVSGTVSISGGIFGMEPQDAWLAEKRMVVPNPDEATQADYPWAVVPSYTVTIGTLSHLTAAWTGGDGSVTNVIDGAGFTVPEGTTNVRVIFTAESGWEIVGDAVVDLGTVTENIVFGGESEYHVPEVAIADPCLVAFGRGSSNMAVAWTSGDGSVTNAVANKVKAMYVPRGSENVRIICTANPGYELVGESVFDLGTVTDDITFGNGNDFVFPIAYDIAANVVYLDWDEANGRMTNAVARAGYWRSVEDSEMACAMKGCMVVTNDVTIPIAQIAGAAVLVLCNDATLTVTGTGDEAGIHVPANASLTITVRKGSTGRVVAQGGADCAGIGSQFKQGSGSVLGAVRIVAGTVTATGGKNGAGIGNGFYGKDGSVKIFGGAVTAVGGVGAASDIGDGGNPYSPCLVSISGGIFARPVQEAWCADHFAVFDNLDPATKSDYPYAVLPASTLTIGKCPIHVSAAWTSGDGSVTNAIEDGSVVMRDGTPNVRVIFTVDDGYALDNAAVVDLGTVTGDIVFGDGNDYRVPHAVPVGAIDYLEWDAVNGTLTNATVAAGEWTLVTDETRTLGDGWYVVAYDVALPAESNIVVNGSARLILCDGALLSVTGGYDQAAIEVSRTDAVTNSLSIYGQAECTGRLTAQGGDRAAVIGTGFYGDFGAVTINGGTVTLTGGWSCPAIGNGWWGQGGAVTINAGRVTAVGDMRRGNCAVSIRGGIFGMSVPDAWCADHHGVFRNLDPATCTEFPYAVLPVWKVTIGDRRYMTVVWTSDDELMTNAVEGTSFKVRHGERNVRVIFTVDSEYVLAGDPVVYVGTVNSDIVFGIGNDFKAPHAGVPYLDWDETNRVMTNAVSPVVCDVYSTSIGDLQHGHWYVVKGEHKISGWSGLHVSGDVHLILCAGSSLTVVILQDPDWYEIQEPGIAVGEGSSLTVYGQANGSGRLTANGGDGGAAGIGGWPGGGCGAVTINGGEVTATGGGIAGYGGAGIGSGYGGNGGRVTINGGTVRARGGENRAGISSGNVTISGGAIEASNMDGSIAISGGIFSAKPKDGWIESGRCRAANMDVDTGETYPWRVVESDTVVTPGSPLGPYETAAAATNALALVEFVPSDEVADALTTVAARTRYADWFGLGVTSKGATEWYVEAALTDAAKLTLAETAANATRQIPITDIAAMSMTGIRIVPVEGGEPGFYYTLYGAEDLGLVTPQREGASGTVNAYGPNLSGLDGKMIFWDVMKPSAASGFFTIGVSATR